MENYEALLSTLALTMGVSWASGINLYAALLVLGIGGATGNIALPESLQVLTDPMVIGAAGFMYFAEFVADKTPGVDTGWDGLHTFVRIPAGAMLAAGAVGDVTPALEIAAGILGGSMAATSHAVKAGSRVAVNTSPEPFSNWAVSIGEDLAVLVGLWTALNHPAIFLALLLLFIILAIWLLPKLWRLVKAIFRKLGGWLGLVDNTDTPPKTEPLPPDSPLTELERLARLRQQGALTDSEYASAKQKLLGQN